MIWSLSIFILTLVGKLVIDYRQHLRKKKIDHPKEAVFVTILLMPTLWLSGWESTLMFFLCFWALFDFCFGILIARNPFFLGTTSFLDRLQERYKFLHVLKYVLSLTSIILYVCLQTNK